MMTTDEAEQLMMPFFPDGAYLAARALSNAMSEQDGIIIPDWIWEAVVQQYFTHLMMKKMALKQEHVRDQLNAEDPFKMNTIPLTILESPSVN